jgi:cellulose biosynthesis protein BcsQ
VKSGRGSEARNSVTRLLGDLSNVAAPGPDMATLRVECIVLDTPPAISLFTRVALAAADYILLPARPRCSSLSGSQQLLLALHHCGW